MEIYNEEINDLLAPEHRKLQIHENLEVWIYYSPSKWLCPFVFYPGFSIGPYIEL